MGRGNAAGAHVLVVAVRPLDLLHRAVGELDLVSAVSRPHAPARSRTRLQHGYVIAQLLQLVGRDQASRAAAEDHDLDAFAGARRGLDRLPLRASHRHQAQRLHGYIRSAVTASLPYAR